jgi:hypothetical protein
MEKEKFVEMMKEAGNYTDEEIERLWKTAPLNINEDKLREKAKEFAKMKLHDVRVGEELNRQLTKIQREKLEKM